MLGFRKNNFPFICDLTALYFTELYLFESLPDESISNGCTVQNVCCAKVQSICKLLGMQCGRIVEENVIELRKAAMMKEVLKIPYTLFMRMHYIHYTSSTCITKFDQYIYMVDSNDSNKPVFLGSNLNKLPLFFPFAHGLYTYWPYMI